MGKIKDFIFYIAILIFSFSILHFDCFAADTLTITTYYPSPYGVYKTVRLFPGTRPSSCSVGELYYDDGLGSYPAGLYYCDNSSAWQAMGGGYWAATPSDPNNIYNINTGNVGIGTNNPNAGLPWPMPVHIIGGINLETADNIWDHNPGVFGYRSRGTLSSKSIVANGDQILELSALAYDGNAYQFTSIIEFMVDGTPKPGSIPSRINFATTAQDESTVISRMVIKNNGNVGIGTSNPQRKLHVLENNLNAAVLVGDEQLIIEANDAGMGIYSKNESSGSSHLDLVEINPDGSFSDFWALARMANLSDGSFRIYHGTNPSWYAAAGNTAMLTILPNGNVGIGTTNPGGGTSSKILSIANKAVAAPTATAGITHLYTSSGEGYWMDQSGNVTLQTPHDPETGEWIFFSKNIKTGRVVRINMEQLVKAVEEVTGKKFMFESQEQPGADLRPRKGNKLLKK